MNLALRTSPQFRAFLRSNHEVVVREHCVILNINIKDKINAVSKR